MATLKIFRSESDNSMDLQVYLNTNKEITVSISDNNVSSDENEYSKLFVNLSINDAENLIKELRKLLKEVNHF